MELDASEMLIDEKRYHAVCKSSYQWFYITPAIFLFVRSNGAPKRNQMKACLSYYVDYKKYNQYSVLVTSSY